MTKLIIPGKSNNLMSKNVGDWVVKKSSFNLNDVNGFSPNEQRNYGGELNATGVDLVASFNQHNSSNGVSSSNHESQVNANAHHFIVKSPLTGKVVSLDESDDDAFSARFIGHGIAIIPTEGKVTAPIDGEVKVAFLGGHAYVIEHDGVEVMIHIGIDTVNINADWRPGRKLLAFNPKVKIHDHVKVGDELSEVDLNYLKRHKYKSITPVIAVNGSAQEYELRLLVKLNSLVTIGTPIFELIKK